MHPSPARPSFRALVAALLGAVLASAFAASSPAHAEIRPTFFGIHDNGISGGEVPGTVAGAIRLWDSGTSWREIERSRGKFDWSRLDAAVSTAQSHDLRPLIVLGQTPRFYATNPKAAGAYGPGSTSMPALRAWSRYVGHLAHRYGTGVDYQVWNEPNVINYWTGTPAQMAKLTAVASRTLSRVLGSEATLVGPSFPLRLAYQQKWFRAFWHQSTGGHTVAAYVDAISANLYPLEHGAPEAQLGLIRFVRHALPAAGRGKPLWNTEINFGLRGGPAAQRISKALQASYVSRTLLLNASSHVGRVYWYAWSVSRIANTHLNRPDGRLTPAGRAWNVTRRWLLGTEPLGCHQATRGRLAGVWTCTFRASPDEVRRVYYKPSGTAVGVTTVRSTRSWSNLRGSITSARGRLHLSVGRLPVMVSSRR